MNWSEYIAHIRQDGELLAQAGETNLEATAPCCPGWTVGDVVAHTGVVHRHKAQIVSERLATNPPPDKAPDSGLLAWYREGLEWLLEVLATTDPATPLFSWWEADQTAGFWYRRMAHETLIHRIDAEDADRQLSPIEPSLAADGVDEVLTKYVGGWIHRGSFTPGTRTAQIACTDHPSSWTLRFGHFSGPSLFTGKDLVGQQTFEEIESTDDPDSVISGTAADLDLWLWGRASVDRLDITGDTAVAQHLRDLCTEYM